MKKLFTLITLLFIATVAAQVSYPYKRPELLAGKEVKVLPYNSDFGSKGFEYFYKEDQMNNYAAEASWQSYTLPKYLEGRVFKVTEVAKDTGKYGENSFYLKLLSDKDETVYYRYSTDDTNGESGFPLEVIGGLDLPADFYCDYINKGANIGEYSTRNGGVTFTRERFDTPAEKKAKAAKEYEVRVKFYGKASTLNRGLTLFFDNGKSIERKNEFVISTLDNGTLYKHETSIILTKQEAEIMATANLTGFKILDLTYTDPPKYKKYAEEFKKIIACILTIKQ
jgi:hypothetical protein